MKQWLAILLLTTVLVGCDNGYDDRPKELYLMDVEKVLSTIDSSLPGLP